MSDGRDDFIEMSLKWLKKIRLDLEALPEVRRAFGGYRTGCIRCGERKGKRGDFSVVWHKLLRLNKAAAQPLETGCVL